KTEYAPRARRERRRNSRRICTLPSPAFFAVWLMEKNDKAPHRREFLLRRLNPNAKNDFTVVSRFDSWMAHNGALLRQWEKIDCRITCQGLAGDFQTEIGSNPSPIGFRHVRARPVLRQQTPITREEFRVRWLTGCRYRQLQLQCCAA